MDETGHASTLREIIYAGLWDTAQFKSHMSEGFDLGTDDKIRGSLLWAAWRLRLCYIRNLAL